MSSFYDDLQEANAEIGRLNAELGRAQNRLKDHSAEEAFPVSPDDFYKHIRVQATEIKRLKQIIVTLAATILDNVDLDEPDKALIQCAVVSIREAETAS